MRLLKSILLGIAVAIVCVVVVAIGVAFCIGMGLAGIWLGLSLADALGINRYDFYRETGAYRAFGLGGFITGLLLGMAILVGVYMGIDEWNKENKKQSGSSRDPGTEGGT